MRLPIIIACVACSLLFASPSGAQTTKRKKAFSSRQAGVVIRVEGGGWGRAGNAEIEALLYAVADELLMQVPKKLVTPIVVTHSERSPIALYEKGPHGEYLVHLSAQDRRWAQFAYQFAHELCHVLSNYEESVGADTTKYNQWFEEALCETASLYTLRSLAARWEASDPAPEWAAHASALRDYAERLIGEGHRQLPAGTALAAWLRQNEERLRHDPYLREKNEVIANLLLPLFERDPENWETLRYLNLDPADARNTLRQYLHNWYANAPEGHKSFLASVLKLLDLKESSSAMAIAAADSRPADTPASRAGPVGPTSSE